MARRGLITALAAAAALGMAPAASGQLPSMQLGENERCDPLDPSVCLYPWPNDHFTAADESTDTGRRLSLSPLSMPHNRLGKPIDPADYNRNDGFSPGQLIVTKVPGLDDPEAFERTGAVPITDMGASFDPDAPVAVVNARTGARHLVWSELDSNPEDPRDVTLLIRPGVNFEEGERYIVALRNLKGADGKKIEAQPSFRALRDGQASAAISAERRRHYEERIFPVLREADIGRKRLYLAWDFTVASERNLSERMLHIRDDAFAALGDADLADLTVAGDPPEFDVAAVTDYTPEQDARIARRVEGTLTVPCYLSLPGCVPGSRFLFEPGSDTPLRLPGNTVEANFICHIPRVTLESRAPARVSLYGHGLLGGAGEIGQGQLKDFGAEHNVVFCATDWDGMSSEDIPYVALILQDLSLFPGLADRVQQGMLNFLYLGRAMVHPRGFDAHPAFEGLLDTRRLFYDGNSQGGIIGGALTAVAVDHERAVLGVPGMNYSTLLRRSIDFDTYAEGNFEGLETPLGLYDNYPDMLERPLILSLVQILWDRAEANGYAHHMTDDPLPNTPPHKVLLHVAFGDHQVADITAEVEARTIGAHAYQPALDPGRASVETLFDLPPIGAFPFDGSALVYWDSGPLRTENGQQVGTPPPPTGNVPPRVGQDPHELPRRRPEARLQKSEFLRIDGRVIDVCGGAPCYAGSWADR